MVLRNAGEYLKKMVEKDEKQLLIYCISLWFFSWVLVWASFTSLIHYYFWWSHQIIFTIFIVLFLVTGFTVFSFTETFYRKKVKSSQSYNKWLLWEKLVEYTLSLIQWKHAEMYVINDFQLELWRKINIDHIIICKYGIFSLETKNINYIEKKWYKAKQQAKNEARELQKILNENFPIIGWVNAVLVYINTHNKMYLESERYCYVVHYKELEAYINSFKKEVIQKPREIFEKLVSLQQKP